MLRQPFPAMDVRATAYVCESMWREGGRRGRESVYGKEERKGTCAWELLALGHSPVVFTVNKRGLPRFSTIPFHQDYGRL